VVSPLASTRQSDVPYVSSKGDEAVEQGAEADEAGKRRTLAA